MQNIEKPQKMKGEIESKISGLDGGIEYLWFYFIDFRYKMLTEFVEYKRK